MIQIMQDFGTAVITGTNRHGVEAAARRAIKLGTFWHRGKVSHSQQIGRHTIILDRKERRHVQQEGESHGR